MDIIGVSGRADLGDVEAFITDLGVGDFTHLYDESNSVWERYGVSSQPAWVFVGADGSEELVFGGLGESAISGRLDALLAG